MPKETEITRPKRFRECADCPVVDEVVRFWQSFNPGYRLSVTTAESVTVRCKAGSGVVYLSDKAKLKVRLIGGTEGETIYPKPRGPRIVPCPHFLRMRYTSPLSESE